MNARRQIALVLVALAVPAVLAAAPPVRPPFQRQIAATVEETPIPGEAGQPGGWSRKIVQPRFEFFTLWPDLGTPGDSEEVLLEQVFTSQYRTDTEGMPSSLTVTAWKSGKSRYDTKLWSFTDNGNEGEIFRYGELYSSTEHGCCASENVVRIYDLRTGRLAATSTVKPGVVEVPNTPVRRIVAFHSMAGTTQPAEAASQPRLLGVLTLSARGEELHRVAVIDAGKEDREWFSPELVLKVDGPKNDGDTDTDITLWAAEKNPVPANIGGFRVELTWYDGGGVARIPVAKDDFDLARATVPPTLKLVRIR